MTQYLIAYNVGGAEYTCRVDAQTWDDAERHLLGLASTGRVLGKHIMDIPLEACKHEPIYEDYITGSWSFCKHCHKQWTDEMEQQWSARVKPRYDPAPNEGSEP